MQYPVSLFRYANLERRNDLVAQLFVDHQTQDTHLGSTSIVQFNSTLLHLPFISLLVPSEINESVAEVTNEFTSSPARVDSHGVLLVAVGSFHGGPGGNHLGPDHARGGRQGGKTSWDFFSTRESDSGIGGQVTNNSKHGNASVLEFHPAKTVEFILVDIGRHSHGVEESQRHLGSQLLGEVSVQGGRGLASLLGRSESSGGSQEGSKDGRFHCVRS
mmetsp:Transcript_1300/g.2704  ORF Transcript_1300/g.2704 Transcript_1300/m.2704 type:complete len:217 (-) Transcript_1300:7-657(-)